MRESDFEEFLSRSMTGISARSYVSRLRRVERELSIDLDKARLTPDAITALRERLMAQEVGYSTKSLADAASALKRYGEFQRYS